MYIISGCLLGHNCKYDGGNNLCPEVQAFCAENHYVVVCPETAGRLPVPRPPAERIGRRVVDKEGSDLTAAFIAGAEASLRICDTAANISGEALEGAILKANSPSCGSGTIYDGTFSGTLTSGDGVFAEALRRRRIPVISEKDKATIRMWQQENREKTERKTEGEEND